MILFLQELWNINFLVVYLIYLSLQVGRTEDAKEIIRNLWGESEVETAINEFQAVIKNDGSDLDSNWLELTKEPHSRGCVKVVFSDLMFQRTLCAI